MRKNIVAGNWKMNLTFTEATVLANEIVSELGNKVPDNVQVIMCPPFPFFKNCSGCNHWCKRDCSRFTKLQ